MHRISVLAALTALASLATVGDAQQASTPSCAPSLGRVSITGVVRDSTGSVMSDVLVRAYGPEADSIPAGPMKMRTSSASVLRTDSTGAFCLRDLAPGRYIVNPRRMKFGMGDFFEQEIAVDLRTPDSVRHLDLTYDPRALALVEQARREGLRRQLAESRARWSAQRPTSYRSRITVECRCPHAATPAPTFVVVGDSVTEVLADTAAGSAAGSSPRSQTWAPTRVDQLFDRVENALADPLVVIRDVQFHPELGFPVLLRTDARHGLTDSWLTLRVPLFEPVQP